MEVLDTTLRDGDQTPGVSFSVEEKVRIALILDELGVDVIEGGYPGASEKDREFFRVMKEYRLSRAKLAAFTGTRRSGARVEHDERLNAVLGSEVEIAVVYGKAWDLHVEKVLRTTLEDNLDMVYDSISYLRSHGLRVIFDAEHFYQGYVENPVYALKVIETAVEAGADTVVLCDTNGGMLPLDVFRITRDVVEHVRGRVRVGVHMHNDSGCAVANTIEAVRAGARHIQGTINGLGERTGNADLIQVLPGVYYKLGYKVLRGAESLRLLSRVSRMVYEISRVKPDPRQPYVGDYAFRHKAGTHIDAVIKTPRAYEHIDPELVGSTRSFELSHLAGSSALAFTASKLLKRSISKSDVRLKNLISRIKRMEAEGYNLSEAQGSVSLLIFEEFCIGPNRVSLDEMKDAASRWARLLVDGDFLNELVESLSKRLTIQGNPLRVNVKGLTVEKLKSDLYRVTVVSARGEAFQRVSSNLFEAILRAVEDSIIYEVILSDSDRLCRVEYDDSGVYPDVSFEK